MPRVCAAVSPRRDPSRDAPSRALNMRAPTHRTRMSDSFHWRAQRWQPAFLAAGMSAFVAAVVTCVNTGAGAGFATRWLLAWSLACPAAIVAAYLLRLAD